MTTKEYLERCKEIDATISMLKTLPNPNKGLRWVYRRDSITAPKTLSLIHI
jgi:hypothetical protein